MIIDIQAMAFSRYGAYVALLERNRKSLSVEWAMRQGNDTCTYNIYFVFKGKIISPQFEACYSHVTVKYKDAVCRIAVKNDTMFSFESNGLDLIFAPKDYMNGNVYSVQYSDGHFEVVSFSGYYASFIPFSGAATLKALPLPKFSKYEKKLASRNCLYVTGAGEPIKYLFNLSEEQILPSAYEFDIDKDIKDAAVDFEDFLGKMPRVLDKHREFAELTWYNLWSCTVRKSKEYTADAILMSKTDMTAVWSWDHCFNALAVAGGDFEFGLNQFLLPFALQCENGCLPDAFGYNRRALYGIVKSPIHGWCFNRLMDMNENIPEDVLRDVFVKLSKQMNWWLSYRDSDGDGIPDYPQGCDSGLDNSSVFASGAHFIESPDLPAYLLLQYKALIRIAEKLSITEQIDILKDKFCRFKKRYYEHSYIENGFYSLKSGDHTYNEKSMSVISILPLVLGEELENEKRTVLIKQLKENYLTEYGIASESPKSRYYKSEGYWLGPVWAPTTYLIIDGLMRAGEKCIALEIAERYINLVINKAKGNYENFDALKGKGLCVKGHSWTASVTMLLLHLLYVSSQ